MSMSNTRRVRLVAIAAGAAALGMSAASNAAVISGTLTERVGVFAFDLSFEPPVLRSFEVGDGVNHVTMLPQFGVHLPWDAALWFYGSRVDGSEAFSHDTDVCFVPGVTDVSQITDASLYTFTDVAITDPMGATHYVPTAPPPDGWTLAPRGLLLMRNNTTGHYGAAIFRNTYDLIDGFDFRYGPFSAVVEIEWYFQTDGTGDFSSVPAPGAMAVLGLGGLVGVRRRRITPLA